MTRKSLLIWNNDYFYNIRNHRGTTRIAKKKVLHYKKKLTNETNKQNKQINKQKKTKTKKKQKKHTIPPPPKKNHWIRNRIKHLWKPVPISFQMVCYIVLYEKPCALKLTLALTHG